MWFIIFLAAALAAAAFAPLEKTLGINARLVYFHGAWVWAALIAFVAAGLVGLAGLVSRRADLHHWSLALGRTAIVFWLAFLPMSLLVMQANWNGLFLDEPRFRVPLNFAIIGVLLQVRRIVLSVRLGIRGEPGLRGGIAGWIARRGHRSAPRIAHFWIGSHGNPALLRRAGAAPGTGCLADGAPVAQLGAA